MHKYQEDLVSAQMSPMPTRAEAEAAVRTLIRWIGEDPDREGLRDTPSRVIKSYKELFGGYESDPREYLARTFEEVGGYDELVVLTDIRVVSFCEHHMLPFLGRAHVGYLPDKRVVGISKLARVVQSFARRLQVQEKLTAEIATAIQDILKPKGVGVVITSEHSCMTMRGVNTPGSRLTPVTCWAPSAMRLALGRNFSNSSVIRTVSTRYLAIRSAYRRIPHRYFRVCACLIRLRKTTATSVQ